MEQNGGVRGEAGVDEEGGGDRRVGSIDTLLIIMASL